MCEYALYVKGNTHVFLTQIKLSELTPANKPYIWESIFSLNLLLVVHITVKWCFVSLVHRDNFRVNCIISVIL